MGLGSGEAGSARRPVDLVQRTFGVNVDLVVPAHAPHPDSGGTLHPLTGSFRDICPGVNHMHQPAQASGRDTISVRFSR
jgi:hypothetical protein